MDERIVWVANSELAELLRRYYQGEAEQWPVIQRLVHAELRERGLPIAPRHVRFRRTNTGYAVIVESAEEDAAL